MTPLALLSTYLPMDRRRALAAGEALPNRASASVLLADIAGFTPLTEALVEGLGPRRGAEELTQLLNAVYTALVSRVHHFGGSVVCFIGDALVSCFGDDPGLRALACALQMQRAMKEFQTVPAPHGGRISLAMKAAVASGPVRRFLVGDPDVQLLDVLAGATVDQLADAQHVAGGREVIATPEVARRLRSQLVIDEWRGRFGVVAGLKAPAAPVPWPDLAEGGLEAEALRQYLLPPVVERVISGHGEFLAELRPVVVLFLRFRGPDYDREDDAGEKLGAFTAWAQRVVSRYGGHVLLLTTADKGSHLYAVFGALGAHEDDGQRAVAAAMELREPPSEVGFITGIQIGVSQGRARVGAYGGEARRTYGALGDAVNLAARLMETAPASEIRCSGPVYESARGHWAFDILPAVTLKGMSRAQALYRPTGRTRRLASGDERDLIGRRVEVETLERCLRTAQSGTRPILLLEGEAGIGKSRLVAELRHLATGTGATWLLGAGDSIEQHTPYRAWRDVLSAFFGLDDGIRLSDQRKRVLEQVTGVNPAYGDRAPLFNDILGLDLPETTLTSGYDSELRQESLAVLIGELLGQRAAVGPVVLVIEDVHWLDSLSWELILSVARTLSAKPLLLVLTHRPFAEPVPRHCAALSRMKGAKTIRLGALPPEETVALAAAQLGLAPSAVPADVATLLSERAEGNPFFAVELIGALRDRGLLVVDGETCSVVQDATALRESVPETLEGVVLSRLDRLPVEEQLTVKVASVIGRSFPVRTLRNVYPNQIEDAELRTHLADTSRRRLTLLETEEPEPSYAFQHIVTQQVAYGTLLFGQRRQLHHNVAGWYERTYVDNLGPFYPLLVFHWNRAGDAEQECHYSRLAGGLAASQHANTEAEIHLSRALELLAQLDKGGRSERRFEVLRLRTKVSAVLGRVDQERSDLEALLVLADPDGATPRKGEVLLLWSDFHKRGGQFSEALEQADAALSVMRESSDVSGEARALTHIGNALEGLGRFQEARDRVEKALGVFRRLDDLEGQAASLKALGITSARLGEFPRAMERFGEARDLYRKAGDKKGEADILGNLGALSYYLGEYEQSVEHTEQAQRLFHEMGHRLGSAKCLTNLGNSYSALGAFADGLSHHERALEIYRQLEDQNGCADSLCNLGIAYVALGVGGHPELTLRLHRRNEQLEEAVDCYAEALAVYARIGSQRGEVVSHFNLGSTELCIGNAEAAETHLHKALELSRELGLSRLVMRSLSALARASLVSDDPGEAMRHSTEAVELLGEQMPPEVDEIHFTHYGVLMANDRAEEALPHLELAHRSVVERAKTLQNESIRAGFLAAYQEILTSWETHRSRAHE